MNESTPPSQPRPYGRGSATRRALFALAVFSWLAFGYVVYADLRTITPSRYGEAGAYPYEPSRDGRFWYWVERPINQKARLARVAGGAPEVLATADEIVDYHASGGSAAWVQRDGKAWSIQVIDANGARQTLPCGERGARSVFLAGDRLFWLASTPGTAGDVPVPAFGPSLQVMETSLSTRTLRTGATLLESDGRIIGLRGDDLYIRGLRHVLPGATVLYRATQGQRPVRLAAETGRGHALITSDGTLYWVAQSRDASNRENNACVRRLGSDGKPATVAEWLPPDGRLYDTGRGIYYVDGSVQSAAWRISAGPTLQRPLNLDSQFLAISAGDGELLARANDGRETRIPLSRVALP